LSRQAFLFFRDQVPPFFVDVDQRIVSRELFSLPLHDFLSYPDQSPPCIWFIGLINLSSSCAKLIFGVVLFRFAFPPEDIISPFLKKKIVQLFLPVLLWLERNPPILFLFLF